MKNKKNVIGIIILLISVVMLTMSVTYAYLKAQVGSGAKVDVKVQSGTVDSLTFDKCAPINLTMTQTNFGENAGNQEGSTCVKATLEANNTTNSATETYNVYLDIKENDFIYTTQEQKTEIILQIKNPAGEDVTSISGLTYNSELEGFDITTKKGLIQVASNYEIKVNNGAENPKTHEWQIKVVLINLETNQALNAGKSFNVEGIIQKDFISMYWNNGFVYNDYFYPSTPEVSYASLSDIPELDTIPIYVKTDSSGHHVCFHYNNKDFCMKTNYYEYHIAGADVESVVNRLRTDMTNTLGVAPTSCERDGGRAVCYYDDVECSANVDGSIMCRLLSGKMPRCTAWSPNAPNSTSTPYANCYKLR